MVFVHSRKDTALTARKLLELARLQGVESTYMTSLFIDG